MNFKKGIKHLTIFCLIFLFLYWGKNAVVRYWSQPLSTDISYKYGDTDQGIQFPLITLCNSNIYIDDKIIKKCGDGSWIFTREIVSCLKSNITMPPTTTSIALTLWISTLHTRRSKVFSTTMTFKFQSTTSTLIKGKSK